MDFTDVLKMRRMVRDYLPDPVPPEALRRIVKMVHRAPSAGFSQGHRLIVITDPLIRKQISDLCDPPYAGTLAAGWIAKAPVLIAVCVREASYHEQYTKPERLDEDGNEIEWVVPYWWFDSGSLFVLLQLAAANEGLATGFFGPHEDGLEQILELPDDLGLAGILTLGYAGAAAKPLAVLKKLQLPLEDLVEWR
ncbi:nitroreductase family protein [Luteipulveratus mongoliensis]|uniref:Nitroreductase n=1 Tax=Luteipulveratus mongoliensis TaxID=571913 RepID=A0A0K1JEZ1_9MICO|nr:nitroreductase family protein [Luteipulveratus mongoliensis]AKU15170.1 nitroreductase [Luteipulveratus mongoliensis]